MTISHAPVVVYVALEVGKAPASQIEGSSDVLWEQSCISTGVPLVTLIVPETC